MHEVEDEPLFAERAAGIDIAEAAGLIIFDHVRANLTRVFANEADRAQYYADREGRA